MIKWDKPCYKCLSHFCDLSCKEPKHLQAPQPKEPDQDQDEVDIRSRLYQRIHELETQLAQPEHVALKRGECWPENVMQMWDYYRKEIANGNTGSEPRDWFESLAEMRLVDTIPPQRTWVGLTKDERLKLYRQFEDCLESDDWEYEKAIEAKLKEKNT